MANTHDYSIANDTGSAVRTDLNTLFTEVEATNAGATAPSNLATGKLWYDTANSLLKQYDGSAWVVIQSGATPDIGTPSAGVVTNLSGVLPVGVTGGSGLDAVSPANLASGVLPVGVTGGSGLDAVSPANLASGVLPVGVTGGSGLNALGTVLSGNLSNTAIVYAAGHVIQTVVGTPNTTVYNSSSQSDLVCTNYNATISKKISGSKIVATFFAQIGSVQNDTTLTPVVTLEFLTSGAHTTRYTNLNYHSVYIASSSNVSRAIAIGSASGMFVDTSSATGNHTYTCYVKGGNSSYSGAYGGIQSSKSYLTLTEVVT